MRNGRVAVYQEGVPEQEVVEQYSTAALTVEQGLTPWLDIFFRADNLFDRDYQEFIGFPNPGIYWRIGMRVRTIP